MKKILALLVSLVLALLLCVVVFAADPTPGTVYKISFDDNVVSRMSSRFSGLKGLAMDGQNSLMYKPYSDALPGGRDVSMQYFNGNKNLSIPAGEYEVTFWVADSSNMVKKKADGDSKIIMTFHANDTEFLFDERIDPADCGHYTDPTKAVAYKELVDITGGEYLVDATGKTQNQSGLNWVQYSFKITLPAEAACANFYLLQPKPCTTHVDEMYLIDSVELTLLTVAETPETEEEEEPAVEPDALYFLDFEQAPVGHTSNLLAGTKDYYISGRMALYYQAYKHPIPGGRDIEHQYFNGDSTKTLPASHYTVTFWAADPDNMVIEKAEGRAKIIMTFLGKGHDYLYKEGRPLAECGQYTNPKKAVAYKELVDFYNGQYLVDTTGETQVKNGILWTQYTFEIDIPKTAVCASFYVQQPWACSSHADSLFLIDRVEIVPSEAPDPITEALDSLAPLAEDTNTLGNLLLIAAVIVAGLGIGAYIMISERKRDEKE